MIKQWLKIIFSYPYCGVRKFIETLIKSDLEESSDKTLLYTDFNMLHIGAKEYNKKKSSEIKMIVADLSTSSYDVIKKSAKRLLNLYPDYTIFMVVRISSIYAIDELKKFVIFKEGISDSDFKRLNIFVHVQISDTFILRYLPDEIEEEMEYRDSEELTYAFTDVVKQVIHQIIPDSISYYLYAASYDENVHIMRYDIETNLISHLEGNTHNENSISHISNSKSSEKS